MLGACDSQVRPKAIPSPAPPNNGGGGTAFGPPPSISADSPSASEGDIGETTILVAVQLSFRSGGVINVEYATTGQSATEGVDYRRTKGRLVFSPGQLLKTIAVPIIGDEVEESDETLILQLHVAR